MKKKYSLLVAFTLFFIVNVSFVYAEDDVLFNFDVDTGKVTEEVVEDIDAGFEPLPASKPKEKYNKDWIIGSEPNDSTTVFGEDDRYRVDTTKYPYSAVVRLGFTNDDYAGTGFLVTPDTVVTAAHCVYEDGRYVLHNRDGYKMKIQPGFDRGYLPFGQADIKSVKVPDGWINGAGRPGVDYNIESDIAVIKLKSAIGNRTGTFGFSSGLSDTGIRPYVNVTGYPGARRSTDFNKYGAMYNSSGPISSLSKNFIHFKIDTTPGHSGGPVYDNDHFVYGINIAENPYENTATRINNTWFNYISLGAELMPKAKKVDKMVNIRSKEYNIWQNFVTWKKKSTTSDKLGNAYKVKYEYEHFDGNTYYSLYDKNNNWQGYINKGGTRELQAKSTGDMVVTVRSENYTIWQNFFWTKKSDTKGKLHKAYRVKYKYDHYNGDTYYSLYDNNNNWQGYINKTGVQELKGESLNKMVTISKTNYTIWQNFFWTKKSDTSDKLGNTYRAKYQYKHSNGSTYYSLYNKDDNWIGYLHSGAAPIMDGVSFNKNVKIKSENYNIFNNFFFDKRDHTKGKLGNIYNAKYVYTRGNGVKYYSLYDKNDNWIGYLDTRATETTNNALRSMRAMPMIEDSSESIDEEEVKDPAIENTTSNEESNDNNQDNIDPHEEKLDNLDNIDPE